MSRHQLFPVLVLALAGACQDPSPHLRPQPTGGDDSSSGTTEAGTDPDSSVTSPDSSGGPSSTSASTTASSTSNDTSDDASTSSATSAEGGTSESSTEGAMPCDGICMVVPDGWMGPVVLASAADAPVPCGDAVYSEAAVDGYAGVIAPEADCDCSCDVGEQVDCDMSIRHHHVAGCAEFPETFDIEVGCNNIDDHNGLFRFHIEASGGSCEASPSTVVPPLGFNEHFAACGTANEAIGACDGDGTTCLPSPSTDAPLCWWSAGDVACPEALMGSREVIYTEDAIDTRGCSACTCGEPEGSCDHPGLLAVTADDTCTGVLGAGSLELDECVSAGATVQSIYTALAPTPTTECAVASQSTATGGVEPQGPITVCCGA